jgi:tyrosinase
MKRRSFVASAAALAAAACTPGSAIAPAVPAVRLLRREVSDFAADPARVAALRRAVAAMQAIADPTDDRSWTYWHYSHWMPDGMTPPPAMASVWNQCRHGRPYFYAWHRGFLAYFERMLQQMSGDPTLALPYWDYYAHPDIPAIFAAPTLGDGSANPLFWAARAQQTVTGLVYAAFDPAIVTFADGNPDGETFESIAEENPHGEVHDAIGGDMGAVPTAARDPLFWVHHCNVDRLWSAWLSAGGGRRMPSQGDPYYAQASFAYDVAGTWRASVARMADADALGYTWSDLALPVSPSSQLPPEPLARVRGAAFTGANAVSLDSGGATVHVPLGTPVAAGATIDLVLTDVRLAAAGANGGFAFNVFVNLPAAATPRTKESTYYVDSFGSFEISIEQVMGMTPVTLTFSLQRPLALQGGTFSALDISFVAYGNPGAGPLVTIGSVTVA